MADFNIEKRETYEDIFGHIYKVDFNKIPMTGGQGVVFYTDKPDLALKILKNSQNEIITDDSQNEKYLNLRILPIPEGLHITLPQVTLKCVEGYVMTCLNSMESFEKVFALGSKFYEKANPDERLIKFFSENPKEYKSVRRKSRIYAYMKTGGLRRRLMAYMKVAAILVRLHTAGLVYGDFSHSNAFISSNLDYENVWLIDADNLSYSEFLTSGFYTPGFCAPEIPSKRAASSFYSDCFSFATALFWSIFGRHPFDGKNYQDTLNNQTSDNEAENLRDLGQFVWILNEDDFSNDGRKYLIISDKVLLSDGLRELFRQIFSVDSCENPTHRPTMIRWAYETAFAFDNVVYSPNCGMDFSAASNNFATCPVDNLKVLAVRLNSYLLDDNDKKISKIWQFTHELNE